MHEINSISSQPNTNGASATVAAVETLQESINKELYETSLRKGRH
ncbi:MAG: hypothetical protein JWP81_1801 [Ferruginibacter sp.]|nr:hypothetical protein [Ferruginibacter sp.]